jgi:hypothetical protein
VKWRVLIRESWPSVSIFPWTCRKLGELNGIYIYVGSNTSFCVLGRFPNCRVSWTVITLISCVCQGDLFYCLLKKIK